MANRNFTDNQVTFEITEHLGVIAEEANGWKRECNIVAWNGGSPKIDCRSWDENHEKMSRGITFSEEQAKTLNEILSRRYCS